MMVVVALMRAGSGGAWMGRPARWRPVWPVVRAKERKRAARRYKAADAISKHDSSFTEKRNGREKPRQSEVGARQRLFRGLPLGRQVTGEKGRDRMGKTMANFPIRHNSSKFGLTPLLLANGIGGKAGTIIPQYEYKHSN